MKLKALKAQKTSPQNPLKPDLSCGRYTLALGRRAHVMGILNLTPDSFSDGGKYFQDKRKAALRAEEMVRDGADIIDVGGESTRPGSEEVSLNEELDRVIPVIKEISGNIDVPISVDTAKSEVAEAAIENGASIVNDVTGLKGDPRMASVISRTGVGVIVMHMKGSPRTMQLEPSYKDLMREITDSLKESIDIAVNAGVEKDKIVVDPGIGFGKTVRHNLTILNRLSELKVLERPIMVGVSRKSFIGAILNRNANERLIGTAAASSVAIMNGANIIRVHDTKELVEVAKIVDAILTESENLK